MIHLRTGRSYACGAGRRWPSQQITSVTDCARVTCGGCARTRAYRAGVDADV